jgi:branched-chain amino acid transport system substrate-binding protein
MRFLLPLKILILTSLVLISCSPNKSPSSSKPKIKIGIVAPLTGNVAFLGKGFQNGFLLAKEESGNTKFDYELIFEDAPFEPRQIILATQKLIHQDKVDILSSLFMADYVLPISRNNHVLHFGVNWDPNNADGKLAFLHDIYIPNYSKALVEMIKKKHYSHVVLISENSKGIYPCIQAILENLKKEGLAAKLDYKFNPGERDFKTTIAQTKKIGTDLYVLICYSPELEIIARQIHEIDPNKDITGTFYCGSDLTLFENQWYVTDADLNPSFIEKYTHRFGSAPELSTPYGYNIFNIIVSVCEKFPSKPSTGQIAQELLKIKDFPGVAGNLEMNPNGIVISDVVVKQIKNGKSVPINN